MYSKALVLVSVLCIARPIWSGERLAAIAVNPEALEVAKGGNEFAAELYRRLSSDEQSNLIFSPLSISMAMAMTYAGVDGRTRDEMMNVLHFPQDESKLHSGINSIRKTLAVSDKKSSFQLRIVNRLWGQKDYQFLPKYLKVLKSDYGSELGLVNFQQANTAAASINFWIEKQTDRKIQNLIAPQLLDRDTRLVLTNAIYFKARWTAQFNESQTSDQTFHIAENRQAKVAMMFQSSHFNYAEVDDIQLIQLPYQSSAGLSMVVLLPKSKQGLTDLETQLSNENLAKWTKELQLANVNLYLPRFKMTLDFSLKETLKSLGISLLFSNQADLSRMTKKDRLHVSEVIHKAFINVDEQGTEAAAATASMAVMGGPRNKPFEFRADHPFVFLIRHQQSQSILFMGRIINPKE